MGTGLGRVASVRRELIVMAPARTEGIEWELGAIVRGGHLGKTIFVFPPLPPSELADRWAHTAELLRTSGAAVGWLSTPWSRVHTVRVGDGGALHATVASRRDEATYRTAVDRSVEFASAPVVEPEVAEVVT